MLDLTFPEVLLVAVIAFLPLQPFVLLFSVTYFVIKSAIKNKKSIPNIVSSYQTIFSKVRKLLRAENRSLHIIFSPFDLIFESLNANAGVYKTIMVSASWIERLSTGNPKWELAFYHTIGHELGHKSDEPKGSYSRSKSATFLNWVRECRADYYGVLFVLRHGLAFDREDVLDVISMKAKYNTRKKEHSDSSHPNWSFRCALLASYPSFDESAIRCIACACGIEDESEIKAMVSSAKLQ